MKCQSDSGSLLPLNDPPHLLEDPEDVGSLHFFHCSIT